MEFDFNSDDFAAITRELFSAGCALIRTFLDADRVAAARDLVSQAHARRPPTYHIFDRDLAADGVGSFAEHCLGPQAYSLLDRFFAGAFYEPDPNTNSRRVTSLSADETWMRPLGPHIDAALHRFVFTINLWVALDDCGVASPGILAVRAPFEEVLAFTGFRPDVPEPSGPRGVQNYPAFGDIVKPLKFSEPWAVARFRRQFAGRIWTPEMRPGDALALTNWTLHGTHVAEGMTGKRENIEFRFCAPNETLFSMLGRH